MRACLHQILRPSYSRAPAGWGDCRACRIDPEGNARCRGYQPVDVRIIRLVSGELAARIADLPGR